MSINRVDRSNNRDEPFDADAMDSDTSLKISSDSESEHAHDQEQSGFPDPADICATQALTCIYNIADALPSESAAGYITTQTGEPEHYCTEKLNDCIQQYEDGWEYNTEDFTTLKKWKAVQYTAKLLFWSFGSFVTSFVRERNKLVSLVYFILFAWVVYNTAILIELCVSSIAKILCVGVMWIYQGVAWLIQSLFFEAEPPPAPEPSPSIIDFFPFSIPDFINIVIKTLAKE
jgi:hypothetical protein